MPTPFIADSPGKRIAHARRLLGVREGADVTVPDLAGRVGVTPASVYGWESDAKTPRDPMLERVAKALRVSAAWIKYGVQSGGTVLDQLAKEVERPASELLKQQAPATGASAKKKRTG